MSEDLMPFDLPVGNTSIIKVVGVGGGGGNAVNHMFRQGIKDVDFIICNTDAQALQNSPVPVKVQLGESLTEGRGAGNKPEQGRQAAIESIEDITQALTDNTKMVFITAGMGGGTGTGAAPIIAKIAQEAGILTVAIVTIPFAFEGKTRISQAVAGIKELSQHVDSLLVINNEKLREVHGDLTISNAFAMADNVLTIAARGIAEIITEHGYVNVDFADVQTVMKQSGVAIMGSARANGEDRAIEAVKAALSSPLLNSNDITGARNILLNITSGSSEVTMDEISTINEFVQGATGGTADLIWGNGRDEELEDDINVTVIATGFETDIIPEIYSEKLKQKTVIPLSDRNRERQNVIQRRPWEGHVEDKNKNVEMEIEQKREEPTYDPNRNRLESDERNYPRDDYSNGVERTKNENQLQFDFTVRNKTEEDLPDEKSEELANLRRNTLSNSKNVTKFNRNSYTENIEEYEKTPAYKRKHMTIEHDDYSERSEMSKLSLKNDQTNNPRLRSDNPYLHDRVD